MKLECSGCFDKLPISKFGINVNSKTGYCSRCKECLSVAPFKKSRFKRTLFQTLKGKGTVTYKEYLSWLDNTKYKKLYKKWVASNYNKQKRPSISKKENDFDWTLDNIRLTTFAKRTKGYKKTDHTRHGLIANIYNNQKKTSRRRKHKPPTYTLSTLKKWVFKQKNFEKLYQKWVKSDFDTMKRPSLDRKKDKLGYSLKNLNLTTWKHNHQRGVSYNGVRASMQVKQYKLTGELVSDYCSMSEASRQTGISSGAISNACNKERPNIDRAGGFKWTTY